MAEYTIPKPYRDFYVTNPYIELKESNERLQRIVKSGYVATDSFDGTCNQVLTFDKEKHGFSLTNDSSKASTWSIDVKNTLSWEQGALAEADGSDIPSTIRIRNAEYIPIINGASYTFTFTTENSNITYSICKYDENKKFTSRVAFQSLTTNTLSFSTNDKYMRIQFANQETAITPETLLVEFTAITLSVSSYTAPSDITVKVAENVAVIPTTADGWEQGLLEASTGLPGQADNYVRSKQGIPIKSNTTYNISISYTDSSLKYYIYEYDKNGDFIKRKTGNPSKFTTDETGSFIKILFFTQLSQNKLTPDELSGYLNSITIYNSDLMIVRENDTRIVTMPPFTSLYIESNVPYHGHALDLAE